MTRVSASRPVRVVDAADPVTVALRLMAAHRLRHLPVVRGGRCVGLLIDRDVVAAVVEGRSARSGALARGPVPVVAPDADAATTARAVLGGGLDAALVVDGGELVGIVTATDVVAAVAGVAGPSPDPSPRETS